MADFLAWLFIALIVVGIIGLFMPLIIFCIGFFGIAIILRVIAKLLFN